VRLLHTADWHLGQTLHGQSRLYEHQRFLDWLLIQLEARAVDVLVVAGDVFDVASPSSEAQAQYYRFLAEVRRRLPKLELVVLGGNHDSPARLDAPAELLSALRIHVVGGLPLDEAGLPDLPRAIIPLVGASGEVEARLLAVPFLRRRDLPPAPAEPGPGDEAHRSLVAGHRALYRQLHDVADALRGPGEALVATGHCYMAQGQVSELSERKIQVGHQHALPADVFDEALAYVALGHLHRAQAVGGRENVRYSGSPIPLSLAEREYPHQVVLVELDGPRFVAATPILVPRTVEIWHVPEAHQPLDMVLPALEALPAEVPDDDRQTWPFLEVRVLLDRAQPRLRQDVQDILQDKPVRLLRIDARRPEGKEGPRVVTRTLDALAPLDVFRARHQDVRGGPAPAALERLFLELLEDVTRREDG
jgi:exonuclease SbcD